MFLLMKLEFTLSWILLRGRVIQTFKKSKKIKSGVSMLYDCLNRISVRPSAFSRNYISRFKARKYSFWQRWISASLWFWFNYSRWKKWFGVEFRWNSWISCPRNFKWRRSWSHSRLVDIRNFTIWNASINSSILW